MDKEKDNVTEVGFDEQEPQTITLTSEDGEDVECEVLDFFEHKGVEYAVLLPVEQPEEEEGEVVILKAVIEEDEEYLEAVEDVKLLEEVFEIFVDRMESQVDE